MEISQELVDAINDQINFELYSAYIYLSMATWLESQNLSGMAHWMEVQFDEEYSHAMRFYRHLAERGARAIMKPIQGPKTEWKSPLEVFDDAYHHEMIVTERIYKIGDIADRLGDRSTQSMLQWFYNEQTEEEKNTMEIRDLLKLIGDSIPALFQLDAKLGARPMAPPVPPESTSP
ncbi:MAG: ferritin [Candidatus Thorarchaeota archaeon]|nr:MAG: ferritin [Candidatus Thorarchaeota archaeon]